jgi:hypothetical protein
VRWTVDSGGLPAGPVALLYLLCEPLLKVTILLS